MSMANKKVVFCYLYIALLFLGFANADAGATANDQKGSRGGGQGAKKKEITANNKTTQQNVQGKSNSGRGGGGGGTHSLRNQGAAQENTTLETTASPKLMRKTQGSNRHRMAVPEKFPKDGVYIWCDPDGLWTIFWKTRQKQTVKATVTTGKPVRIKSAVKSKIKKLGTQSNSLEIYSDPNSGIGIVQFSSTDDSIQCDILFNGSADPNHVYIGSRLDKPKQFPLKLDTRRTYSNKEIRGTKSARNQESTRAFKIEGDSTLRSKKAPVPVALSGGGFGRGGGKVGKAQE